MRLQNVRIKNFRSIKEAEVSLLDLGIATLVGANGSGKSNVLKAIVALLGDSSQPSDDDFYAKEGEHLDDVIEIVGTFVFEDRDKLRLEERQLAEYNLTGMVASVIKRRNTPAAVEFMAVGLSDKRETVAARQLAELLKLAENIDVQPESIDAKATLLVSIRRIQDLAVTQLSDELDAIRSVFDSLAVSESFTKTGFVEQLGRLHNTIDMDLHVSLEGIFGDLSAELLDFVQD